MWERIKRWVEPPERFLGINFGDDSERFLNLLKKKSPAPRILDVGAGSMQIFPGVITMELLPTESTDVAGDATRLPFRDGSMDGVVILNVLEHVENPIRAVSEIRRILSPGGIVYAVVPFIFPYHEAPRDNWRYTVSGLSILFECLGFRKVHSGFEKGPCSAYLRLSIHFWALFFSFNTLFLYKVWRVLFSYLFSPFRFFDYIMYRYRLAHIVCSSIAFIGEKVEKGGERRSIFEMPRCNNHAGGT